MSRRKGKIVSVTVTPYHILDVMTDPAYMPFFVRRFHIAMEIAIAKGNARPYWSITYEKNIKLFYDDCIDEIKRMLGMQETSASSVRIVGMVKDIVLNAVEDWINEKEHRTPRFEVFPNTVKSAITSSIKHYGPYVAEQERKKQKAAEDAAPSTTLYLGDPGASPVREKLDRGNECDDLL